METWDPVNEIQPTLSVMKSAEGNFPHTKRFPPKPRLADISTVSLSNSFTTTSYATVSGGGEGVRVGGREAERERGGGSGGGREGEEGKKRERCQRSVCITAVCIYLHL